MKKKKKRNISGKNNPNFKHGMRNSLEYCSWDCMKKRCFNKNTESYPWYGGRGITVCKRWLKFENFIKDMGKKPNKNYTIDRVNPKKNYTPKNCRWATTKIQAANKRKVVKNAIN